MREMAGWEGGQLPSLGYSTLLDTGTLWGLSFSGIMSTCITINSTNLLGEQRFTKGYLQNCVPLTSATEEKIIMNFKRLCISQFDQLILQILKDSLRY